MRILICLSCLFLIACPKKAPGDKSEAKTPKKAAEADAKKDARKDAAKTPSKEDTKKPEATKKLAPPKIAKPSAEDAAKMTKQALLAAGCPQDKLTATGCKVCPTKLAGSEFKDQAPDPMAVRVGAFAPGTAPSVLISYAGCSSRAGGENQVTVMTQKGETWAEIKDKGFMYNDSGKCTDVLAKDGRVHIFCAISQGSQGCYSSSIETPNFHDFDIKALPPVPEECTGGHATIDAVKDLDGDGDQDMLITYKVASKPYEDLGEDDAKIPPMVTTKYKILQDEKAWRSVKVP